MFNVNGLANRQVGDMTNCNILYKELMEKIQLGLLYNSKTIIDIERQRFEVLGNYLTIRQNEDLKQIFENANRNLNDNSLTLR